MELEKQKNLIIQLKQDGFSNNNAGILCVSRTYGRTENGKRLLYKCIPDDRSLPTFLVPYQIAPTFEKAYKNKYILFRCVKWDAECPFGEITDTLGDVDSQEAFNEYQVCRYKLNIPLTDFTNTVKRRLRLLPANDAVNDNEWNLIEKIMLIYPGGKIVDLRNYDNIITIDPSSCTDFDDAFSTHITGNVVTVNVYISAVFLWMETFRLWESITDRVSTIYLPDKKWPMLPALLSDTLCSLQQQKNRFAFVMSTRYDIHTGKQLSASTFMNALINVSKNYSYDDPSLNRNKTYGRIRDITGHTDSHDVVAWWMIKMNEECANCLMRANVGIFRIQPAPLHPVPLPSVPLPEVVPLPSVPLQSVPLPDAVKRWLKTDGPYDAAKYSDISASHTGLGLDQYLHITSPIRRIADIINQTLFMKHIIGLTISIECTQFLEKWMGKIEYMNEKTRNIRRIQMDCELLNLCNRDSHTLDTTYTGMAIANERTGEYTIYIEALKLITYIKTAAVLPLFVSAQFQIYVFNDESRLSRKIRIRHLAIPQRI